MQKPRVHLRYGDGGAAGKKRGAVGSGRALQGPLGSGARILEARTGHVGAGGRRGRSQFTLSGRA